MILNKIHAVYLFVENVRLSSSWYSKVLGIPLEIDEIDFGLIKIGENELCFHQADAKSPKSTGGCVTYWKVDVLLEAINIFVENGGAIYRGPIEIQDNEESICQIIDPFGNVIGLQGKSTST